MLHAVIRLPDIWLADLGFTVILFLSFFYLFSPASLGTRWNILNQNRPHAGKQVQFENACQQCGVSPPPTNWGPKNHLFKMSWQLNGNLNGLYFPNETQYRQSASMLATRRGLIHCLKTAWTSVHTQLKIGLSFLPTVCKYCILIHFQALQTEINKRSSTKHFQTVAVHRANNLPSQKIVKQKNFYICPVFWRLPRLNGKYLLNERRHTQSAMGVRKHEMSRTSSEN